MIESRLVAGGGESKIEVFVGLLRSQTQRIRDGGGSGNYLGSFDNHPITLCNLLGLDPAGIIKRSSLHHSIYSSSHHTVQRIVWPPNVRRLNEAEAMLSIQNLITIKRMISINISRGSLVKMLRDLFPLGR